MLDKEMTVEKTAEVLTEFGIEVNEAEKAFLDFLFDAEREAVLNYCNISVIPDELIYYMVNRLCGQFMRFKQDVCINTENAVYKNAALKGVSMGDISVTFADDMTPLEKYEFIVEYFINSRKGELDSYRRLKW